MEIPFHTSAWPVAAIGDGRVTAVKLSIQGAMKTISCDYLACGFHLTPNIELPALIGCKLNEDKVAVDEWQQTSLPNIYCAGEPTGIGGLELSLIEGEIAGLSCANQPQKARALFSKRSRLSRFAARLAKAFALRHELKSLAQQETLICRCEDVAFGEVCKHSSWANSQATVDSLWNGLPSGAESAARRLTFCWDGMSIRFRPPVLPALISSLASSRPPGEAQRTHRNVSRRK